MTVRIAIWNMARNARSWEWLAAREDIEIALLQEALPIPERLRSVFPGQVRRAKRGGPWGSAIVARSLELVEVNPTADFPWLNALPGSSAIARLPSHDDLWLASVHLHHKVVAEELSSEMSTEGIHLSPVVGGGVGVWEQNVIPHELRRLFAEDRFLWGGDFNSEPRMDEVPDFAGGNGRQFDVYREAGSIDLRNRFHSEPVQTFFPTRRARRPWQLDHVFADASTERLVTAYIVDVEPVVATPRCSDHAPIVIDLAG